MAQVKTSIKDLDIPGKIRRLRLVSGGLNGNPNIPDGDVLALKLETVATKLETKNDAQLAAKKAWGLTVDDQNATETEADSAYSNAGADVQSATGGDETKILTTYFEVRATPSKAPIPGKILNLQATQGDDAGEIDLHWDGLKEATSYASQITADADPNSAKWNYGPPVAGKRSASQIKNLTSNQGYWLRVQGINPTGEGPWSDPVYKASP
ncbi:MAG TPA: fibronectin type III domain-containing protein [Abditibacterium sp.]|jgi:hypothetical protein